MSKTVKKKFLLGFHTAHRNKLPTSTTTFSDSSRHKQQLFLWVSYPNLNISWSKKLIFILSISKMPRCRWRIIFLTNFYLNPDRTPKEKVVDREASYPKMWSSRSVAYSLAPLWASSKNQFFLQFLTKIGLHRNTFSSNLFNSFTRQNPKVVASKWVVDHGIC